jgi:hypothetical protein
MDQKRFQKEFRPAANEFLCACRGRIRGASGRTALELGDVQSGAFFKGKKGLKIDEPLLLLSVKPGAV